MEDMRNESLKEGIKEGAINTAKKCWQTER